MNRNAFSMMNRALLIGEVETTPLIQKLPNGGKVANFTLMTEEQWRDKVTNQLRSKKERHKIAVFADKLILLIEQDVKVGTLLFIQGQIEGRTWKDSEGTPKVSIDIVIRPMRGTLSIMEPERDA